MSHRRRVVLWGLAALLLVAGVLTERWFVHPEKDDPGTADVIYVLGGGGPRVEFALDLVREGVALHVVFASRFVDSEEVWVARPCNDVRPENVPDQAVFQCREPDPATTRGEAQLLRDLSVEYGWQTVVVVASTDQITRTRRLIERCWDGELRITGPGHTQPWPIRAIYEWGASIKATLVRGC